VSGIKRKASAEPTMSSTPQDEACNDHATHNPTATGLPMSDESWQMRTDEAAHETRAPTETPENGGEDDDPQL
jgi:hypothetical protein